MRLRHQVVDFGAMAAKACAARVCQPLPLARQAASTSGSRRKVTGALCTACTGRPTVRRAMICSGVCTRPSPRWACCKLRSSDRNNASSNSRISGSALGLIVSLDINFFHQGAQQVSAPNPCRAGNEVGVWRGIQYRFFVHRINANASQVEPPTDALAGGDPQAGGRCQGLFYVRLNELLNRAEEQP